MVSIYIGCAISGRRYSHYLALQVVHRAADIQIYSSATNMIMTSLMIACYVTSARYNIECTRMYAHMEESSLHETGF